MLARGVRNVIYNYTDAQRKVRSATSNDAWGPSPALMHEIADLTDNVVAYAEIMPIIWKRLNDHGKNWRHVYKSLVLLDHLIKYGSERVSQQCKENIFAIQTLKDFQYIEDQKDQGYNVREKAKQLVALLKDDERLRNERRKAQEARERYSRQAVGMDSSGAVTYGRPASSVGMRRNSSENGDGFGGRPPYPVHPFSTQTGAHRSSSFNENLHAISGKEFVQPSNQEEEQLQMQIALAESQREAEDEERRRRNDELKLKIALERSVNESSPDGHVAQEFSTNPNSHGLDSSLFDASSYPHSYMPPPPTTTSNIGWNPPTARPSTHLGFTSATNDPWSPDVSGRNSAITTTISPNNDPWQNTTTTTSLSTNTTTAQVNPWSNNDHHHHPTTTNGNGLSVNTADPWGVSANTSSSTGATSKPIDNELSEFFGAGATISTNDHLQQQGSSNPWNVPSSTFPPSSNLNQSGSISPPNNGLTIGGPILYPTGNNSNSNNPSPLPSIARKTPESFLGEDFCNLVNLDKLVTQPKTNNNPFGSTAPRVQNPFANLMKPPTLEQLTLTNTGGFTTTASSLPPPLIPSSFNNNNNNTTTSINSSNPFM